MSEIISTAAPSENDTLDIRDICDALKILAEKLGESDAEILLAAAEKPASFWQSSSRQQYDGIGSVVMGQMLGHIPIRLQNSSEFNKSKL
jgi:hypothetical protein